MIKSITMVIKNKEYEFSYDEAKEIYNNLRSVFDKNKWGQEIKEFFENNKHYILNKLSDE